MESCETPVKLRYADCVAQVAENKDVLCTEH